MRYFIEKDEGKPIKLAFLPSDPHYSWMVWLHFKDGVIERWEATQNGEKFSEMKELTEEQARAHDPEMFAECLARPYADHPSMIQFYIHRAQECVDYKPVAQQVLRWLIGECGCGQSGSLQEVLKHIEGEQAQEFGIIAYGTIAHYISIPQLKDGNYASDYAQEKIKDSNTCRAWWRYNTLEKNLSPEVFNDRMRRL